MPTDENTFADKLNRLFEEKTKTDGTPYSKKEVIASSPILTRVTLWRLQAGKVSKPSYEVVKALADFFGVPPNYFFENAQGNPAENNPQEELQVLLRSFGLGKTEQKAVFLMIDSLKKSQKK